MSVLAAISIACGFASAASWGRAALVKVTRDRMVAREQKRAAKDGRPANLAGISLDGWDMAETFNAQSFWNALGAGFAAVAVLAQSISAIVG